MLLPLPVSLPSDCEAPIAERRATTPTIRASVIANVQIVERRVRNLIHSDFTTRGKVSRTSLVREPACEDVAAGGARASVLIGSGLPYRRAQGLRQGGWGRRDASVSGQYLSSGTRRTPG